jgi:hypothetical protein
VKVNFCVGVFAAELSRWKGLMKIYDPESKRIFKKVTLFLTLDEAADLGFSATDLSDHPEKHHHHVNDSECKKEITVSVYTDDNLSSFDEESKRVISEKD